MDVEAWKRFSYVFDRNLRKNYLPDPVWPDSFLDALDVFGRVLKIEGRNVSLRDGKIIIRITECETQKAIARAGVAKNFLKRRLLHLVKQNRHRPRE